MTDEKDVEKAFHKLWSSGGARRGYEKRRWRALWYAILNCNDGNEREALLSVAEVLAAREEQPEQSALIEERRSRFAQAEAEVARLQDQRDEARDAAFAFHDDGPHSGTCCCVYCEQIRNWKSEPSEAASTEPLVDWESLSPAEVFAALTVAPKVAGPWTQGPGESASSLFRLDPHGNTVATDARNGALLDYVIVWVDDREDGSGHFADRDAADARLRELGWLLVDDPEGAPPPDNVVQLHPPVTDEEQKVFERIILQASTRLTGEPDIVAIGLVLADLHWVVDRRDGGAHE